jgi:hypothetical protein
MTGPGSSADELQTARRSLLLFLVVVAVTVDGYLAIFFHPLWWSLALALLTPTSLSLLGIAARITTFTAFAVAVPIVFLTITSVFSLWPYFLLDPVVAAIYDAGGDDVELAPAYLLLGTSRADIDARLEAAGFDELGRQDRDEVDASQQVNYLMFGRFHLPPFCRDELHVMVTFQEARLTDASGTTRPTCL